MAKIPRKTIDLATVSPNASFLEFPMDYSANTLRLRREGIKAASRVGITKHKLDTLLLVLDILKAHAQAKFDERVKESKENAV